MKTYLFVDAENHYLRATSSAERAIGSPKAAQAMSMPDMLIANTRGFPDRIEGRRFGWNPGLHLFWDCYVLSRDGALSCIDAHIARAVYVCSYTGDDDKAHQMRVQLRGYGFEPIVVREPKDLRQRRGEIRDKDHLIEKPKGCDIAIATRMVADAAANLYDCCFLFTSDADFLPAVEAVRQIGKVVWVFGFASALSTRSAYFHVPEKFVDLGPSLQTACDRYSKEINAALEKLGEPGPPNARY